MTTEFLTNHPKNTRPELHQITPEEPFKPTGALVFFCGMVVMFALLWFALYGIVLRQN
jgi:hypothetical protein